MSDVGALVTLAAIGIPLVLAAVTRTKDAKAAVSNGKEPATPPTKGPTVPASVGGSIVASFPESDFAQRDRMILSAVIAGLEDPIIWSMVTMFGTGPLAGWELDVPVMADALKIDGVRMTMSYEYAQYIADALTARSPDEGPVVMMTPWLDATTFEQADAPLSYTTSAELNKKNVTALTSQMVNASQVVDAKLAALIASGAVGVAVPNVGNTGKNWNITEKLLWPGVHPESKVPHTEAAVNQGFYPPGQPFRPVQYRGVAHGRSHVDYSQSLRLAAATSFLRQPGHKPGEGTDVSTSAIIMDPNLGPLINGPKGQIRGKMVGEGTLPFSRHPKIPPLGMA